MSSIVVVNNVSPVVWTGYVDRIRYGGSGVVGVPETQYSVLFAWSGRNVDGESKKIFTLIILFTWLEQNDKSQRRTHKKWKDTQ